VSECPIADVGLCCCLLCSSTLRVLAWPCLRARYCSRDCQKSHWYANYFRNLAFAAPRVCPPATRAIPRAHLDMCARVLCCNRSKLHPPHKVMCRELKSRVEDQLAKAAFE